MVFLCSASCARRVLISLSLAASCVRRAVMMLRAVHGSRDYGLSARCLGEFSVNEPASASADRVAPAAKTHWTAAHSERPAARHPRRGGEHRHGGLLGNGPSAPRAGGDVLGVAESQEEQGGGVTWLSQPRVIP